ncbi:uncharacterized protein CLAFUR5_07814 [Fulvia fulva]|uniref:Inositolphosphotransferase Aur1/Ipt1 domain-containing protein n=1 Tax=Passalora fulva TaxID=5499 RepID=A0A9Q8LCY8_PASFU|nr:uncharacterized protein CLAFUR5_07814 [Fulvia fulva]KAK4630786.1 hypothetical protein CLAFUR0_07690 [Fulvia fulva]UJO15116.1 hypothetical protein CLAFUR5_07814 [Fulvia fulva]
MDREARDQASELGRGRYLRYDSVRRHVLDTAPELQLFGGDRGVYRTILDRAPGDPVVEEELMEYSSSVNDDDRSTIPMPEKQSYKKRSCCGLCIIRMPNTSRFKTHVHSRVFQKFPFVVEQLYWVLNYLVYRMTTVLSNKIFAGQGIWTAARAHALAILDLEQSSWLSFMFPVRELDIQQWFMHGHQDALTFLDRFYALIHIPGSMFFIVWYYYAAPSHTTFATVRRTITLTNFMAFCTFVVFPTMPPRLLPKEYGFLDTVHMEDAESLWQAGKYVNALAAMPSMHFGYSFIIGCTLVYHSGILRTRFEKYESRKSIFWKSFYLLLGVSYSCILLVTIIATSNHFWLDALMAFFCCCIAFACNKVFFVLLPIEDAFLWIIRAEKPIPSTGERYYARGGGI